MADFKLISKWLVAGNDVPKYRQTMAMLELHVGHLNLMKNQDIWSNTIQEFALMSAYPLAMWLAFSWWRLHWEPLPARGVHPPLDWRMAHELGAANHGFVWPQVIFASDREVMQVWAVPSSADNNQSVKYLNGFEIPENVTLPSFQRGVEDFISTVLRRLDAVGCQNSELASIWQLIQEERSDRESTQYRRVEAEMGYNPDECPEELIKKAFSLDRTVGTAALSELTPLYGKPATEQPLAAIERIAESPGIVGTPAVPRLSVDSSIPSETVPWKRAVAIAGALRDKLGNLHDLIDNKMLNDLLGLRATDVEQWTPAKRSDATVAVPCAANQFKFIPRKKHPIGKRFELARLIGDYLLTEQTERQWLTSTDLRTSRQKFQRAFAAEFLCPIASLRTFLNDDYSEPATEDAADHFQVSKTTINSLLVNNELLPAGMNIEERLPYQLAV